MFSNAGRIASSSKMSATWLGNSCGVSVSDTSSYRPARCSLTAVPTVPSAPVTRTRREPMACSLPAIARAGNSSPSIFPLDPAGLAVALLVDDPDAPGESFTHWLAWSLEPDAGGLREGERAPLEGLESDTASSG